jgi:hypothetical protein
MKRHSRWNRTRLAIGGLLIAFSLEICGCNPAPSCDRLLDTPLASLAWEDFAARCGTCLTSRQIAGLKRRMVLFEKVGLLDMNAANRTVRDALRDEENPSFYDPQDGDAENFARSAPSSDELSALKQALVETKPSPWPIPESVYFVYNHLTGRSDASGTMPNATAFVLSVPDKEHRAVVRFLVTARHVVDPQWAHCRAENPEAIEIRLNKWSGGVGFETIPLESHHSPTFFTPADDQSDVAILYLDQQLIPRLEDYKFIEFPFRLLPTDTELRTLRAELEVTTAGLSPSPQVGDRVYPAFRSGVLSKLTGDTIDIQCGSTADPKPVHLWFLNATIPHGVSGAPVYASIHRFVETDRFGAAAQVPVRTPVLLGIQSMAWPSQGVAGITPSGALRDLVQSALAHRGLDMDLYRGPG